MKNRITVSTILISGSLISGLPAAFGQPNPQGRPARPQTQSPASRPRPKSTTADLYCRASPRGRSAVRRPMRILPWQRCRGGRIRSRPDPRGTGCKDTHGDKLGPMIRAGRPNAGMPAFNNLSEDELNAIVGFSAQPDGQIRGTRGRPAFGGAGRSGDRQRRRRPRILQRERKVLLVPLR